MDEQPTPVQPAQPAAQPEPAARPAPAKTGLGVASVFFAIFAILFFWFPFIGLVFASVGLVFAEMQKMKGPTGAASFGLVVSIIAMIINLGVLFVFLGVMGFGLQMAMGKYSEFQGLIDTYSAFQELGGGPPLPMEFEKAEMCTGICVDTRDMCSGPGQMIDPSARCPDVKQICCVSA